MSDGSSDVGSSDLTQADERVARLEQELAAAPANERGRLRAQLATVRASVRNEVLGQVAAEFDAVHSVERARDVGSVHELVTPSRPRPAPYEARSEARRLGTECVSPCRSRWCQAHS